MSQESSPASVSLNPRSRVWSLLRFPGKPLLNKKIHVVRLAWPAYAWRVVTPHIYDDAIDPLERLFLRLIRAGVTKNMDISHILSRMSPTLVKYIIESCLSHGLIKQAPHLKELILTSDGEKILASDDPLSFQSPSMDTGWIFRDALRGDIIPMFFRGSLPLAPSQAVNEVIPLPANPTYRDYPPSMQSIVGALRRYQKLARYEQLDSDLEGVHADQFDPDLLEEVVWQDIQDDEEDFTDPSGKFKDGTKMTRISESSINETLEEPISPIISSVLARSEKQSSDLPRRVQIVTRTAEKVDLETYWYMMPDDPEEWLIRSPFGLRGGGWFQKQLQWGIERDEGLKKLLDEWKKLALEQFKPSRIMIESEEFRIINRFPILKENDQLHETLRELTRAYRAEKLFHEDSDMFDNVLTRYHMALEALLAACIDRITNIEDVVKELKHDFPQKLHNLQAVVSFEIPKCFRYKGFVGKVAANALSSRVQKFQALRDRALFLSGHAYYDENSPFRSALKAEPKLLAYIDFVAEGRNKGGAHFDSQFVGRNVHKIVQEVQDVSLRILEVLVTCFFEEPTICHEKI